jgi:hypothetical protein
MKNDDYLMRYLVLFYIITTLSACSAGIKFPKSQIQKINTNFSGSYLNKAVDTKNGIAQNTLTSIFEIDENDIEVVDLKIIDSTTIELSSSLQSAKKTWRFKGFLSDSGFFEVYIRNNIDGGINSFADIKIIKFTSSTTGTLLVDDYERNERQFLLWRSGGRSRTLSEFRPTPASNKGDNPSP